MASRKRNRARKMDKRLRRKLNKKARSATPVETEQIGPLTVSRAGRFLHIQSNLSESDLAEMHERMREHRPDLKNDINAQITELLDILARISHHLDGKRLPFVG